MRFGDVEVVGLDRDGLETRGDKPLTLAPSASFCQLNADFQLRHGDRGDSDVIAVADHLVQRVAAPLGVDQDRRIEDQSRQGPVTGSIPSPSSCSSPYPATARR